MKKLFLFTSLLALAGCGSKGDDSPAPADSLLGHWQSKGVRTITYDATDKQTADQMLTQDSQLDVTATTLAFSRMVNGQTVSAIDPYTRNGESLTITLPDAQGIETCFVRNLTNNSFTMEYNSKRIPGDRYYVQTQLYTH